MLKFWFQKRREIDSQNTGRFSFQQPMGKALSAINGNGGIAALGTIRAMQRATIVPGYTVRPADLAGVGNTLNQNLTVSPLSGNQSIL